MEESWQELTKAISKDFRDEILSIAIGTRLLTKQKGNLFNLLTLRGLKSLVKVEGLTAFTQKPGI